jgi:Tol biopolymer transport system component
MRELSGPASAVKSALAVLGLSFAFGLAHHATAHATLQLLKQNPSDPATFSGKGGYSADGLGQDGTTGGTLQAEVPAGSTVVQAYLYGSYFFNTAPDASQRTIDFDGTDVVLNTLPNSEPGNSDLSTARATVTSQVAAKVGSGGGITNFAINNDPSFLDGVALVVIFSNPSLPENTIAVLDGGSKQAGDTVTFNFASPIDKSAPGFAATMALGSGFSFQAGGSPSHICGEGAAQSSLIDVNSARLTSCAGNFDDGAGNNGALITVGGVGDSTNNPADPNQEPADGGTPRVQDDELYNLAPLMDTGDTQLTVDTSNPSADDNLFLAIIATTAEAAVTTEICDNGIDDDGDGLVDDDDPDCQQPPPTGEVKIAFASNRTGNGDVYSMNDDGSDQTRLTTSSAFDGFPGFAPGGKRIAFSSDRTDAGDLYAMDADGSDQFRLTTSAALDSSPHYSPNGKLIVYSSRRSGNGDIWLLHGARRQQLTSGGAVDSDPSWSPGGKRIAFASNRTGNGDIYVMNADGSGLTRVTTSPAADSSPDWSPNGRLIVYASRRSGNGDIWLIHGARRQQLTTSPAVDGEPTFLQDGRIAFASRRTGNGDIYVMNLNGSAQTRLTTSPAVDGAPDSP